MRTIGLHTYTGGDHDGYGIPAPSWEPALDEEGTEVEVFGWAPRSSTEGEGVGPNALVETELDLLAPPGTVIFAEDVVDLPEGQFQVIGDPLDYGYGPYGYNPGIVVRLKQVWGSYRSPGS